MPKGTFDALAITGDFQQEYLSLLSPFDEEAKKAHHEAFKKTTHGVGVCRTPENLDYSQNEELRGFKFFWRAYYLCPEFQPHHFEWKKLKDNLYGGTLKDDSFRTRKTLPAGGPTLVLR